MQRDRRPIMGRGEYTLGFDQQELYNISIRRPRVSTDHQMILPKLKGCGTQRTKDTKKGYPPGPLRPQKGDQYVRKKQSSLTFKSRKNAQLPRKNIH